MVINAMLHALTAPKHFMLTFKVILLVSCLPETWKDEG